MTRNVWESDVEIYDPPYIGSRPWKPYTFRVIAGSIMNAYEKVQVAIRRQGFRHKRYRINAIKKIGPLD